MRGTLAGALPSASSLARRALLVAAGGAACALSVAYIGLTASLLLLAEAALVLAVLARPQRGVPAVLAGIYLLPFAVNPLPAGLFRLPVVDVLLLVALLAWVLRPPAGTAERPLVTAPGALLLLFLGLSFAVLLFNLPSTPPERVRLFLRAVNGSLLFFTVINTLHDGPSIRMAARAWLLLAAAAGFIAVVLYLLPSETSNEVLGALAGAGYPGGGDLLRHVAGTGVLRATGTAVDPNLLGGMLLVVAPLAAAQLFAARPILPRAMALAAALCIAAVLLLTLSRTAWLGATLGIVCLGALRYRRALLLPAAAPALLLLPQGRLFLDRLLSGLFFADQAAQMRLGEYQDALQLIGRYPVLGVGFGDAPSVDTYVGASNMYLLVGEQMGLAGLGLLLLVLAGVFRAAWQGWEARDPEDGVRAATIAGLAAALGAGLFDHYYLNIEFPQAVALFWGMAGLTVAAARQGRPKAQTAEPQQREQDRPEREASVNRSAQTLRLQRWPKA